MDNKTTAAFIKRWGIALTGGIATGKSTISRMLQSRAFFVIDADVLSREVVGIGTDGLTAVRERFGDSILQADGGLDRARMRELIFSNPELRVALEDIVHPRLAAATEFALRTAGLYEKPRIWFYEASLIYERGRAGDFREVWACTCSEDEQIRRLIARDHCDRETALTILKAQMPVAIKAARANHSIDTEGNLAAVEARLDQLLVETGLAAQSQKVP